MCNHWFSTSILVSKRSSNNDFIELKLVSSVNVSQTLIRIKCVLLKLLLEKYCHNTRLRPNQKLTLLQWAR